MNELRSMLSALNEAELKALASTAGSILLIVVLAGIVRMIAHRLVRMFRTYAQHRTDDPGRAQRTETVARTIRYVLTVVIVIVAGTLILGQIGVENWGDSAVILRCRLKIVPPIEQWTVRREFLKRLKTAFDHRGIEIPFPHLTLYPGQPKNGSAPPMHVVSKAN